MSWHYQIVRKKLKPPSVQKYSYGIVEVYRRKNGKIFAWGNPKELDGFETEKEVLEALGMMLLDGLRNGVMQEQKLPKEKNHTLVPLLHTEHD